MKNFLLTLVTIFIGLVANAQEKVEMADGLRSEGKIYVVVAVMLVIFITVAIYLFTIDRRIKKLENDK